MECTFLEAAVRAGEVDRDYDDLMGAFHNAFFAKDCITMDYIEQVCLCYLVVVMVVMVGG